MPRELIFSNGEPTDAPQTVDCRYDDCDYSVPQAYAAHAFIDGCPECGR